MLVFTLYLLELPMRLNKGIPGSYRVWRKAVWLTSVHLTYWFLKQQRNIAMLLESNGNTIVTLCSSKGDLYKTAECNANPPIDQKQHRNSLISTVLRLWPELKEAVHLWSPCKPVLWLWQFGIKEWWRTAVSRWTNLIETHSYRLKSETVA